MRRRYKLRYMIYATAPDGSPRSFDRTTKRGVQIFTKHVLTWRLTAAVRKARALVREGCTDVTIERHEVRRVNGRSTMWVTREWVFGPRAPVLEAGAP